MTVTIKKALFAASMTLLSFNAQAALSSYTTNGIDLVYSSVSDVTWLKNGNLLGSMIASQGYDNVIDSIIAASPTITSTPSDFDGLTGTYNISRADFPDNDSGSGLPLGFTNWFGAMAFVNYLNAINYAGHNQWRLPTASADIYSNSDGVAAQNGVIAGEEYAELYYNELGRSYNQSTTTPTLYFENEQERGYWTGTEYPTDSNGAVVFSLRNGVQGFSYKGYSSYAWVVTSGQVASIPEPESITMLLAGLGMLGIAVRRNK